MKIRRALSILLSAALACSLACAPALAADETAPAEETAVTVEVENGGKLVIDALEGQETLKYEETEIPVYILKPGVQINKFFAEGLDYTFTVRAAEEAEGVITLSPDTEAAVAEELKNPAAEQESFFLALDEGDALYLVEIQEGESVMVFAMKSAPAEEATEPEAPAEEPKEEATEPETPTEEPKVEATEPEAPAEEPKEEATEPETPVQPEPPVPEKPAVSDYTVQKGDTLGYIAVNYYGSYAYSKALYQANAEAFRATVGKLVPGMTLTLPETLGDAARLPQAVAGAGESLYTVQSGDTLGAIARTAYGSAQEYKAIFERNRDRIQDANRIYTGQIIVLPAK
ncbi:MAG: LysM peptidoglycan-binding domain-containing protein [Lawsonibacter sp.]|nr:LysM peptidoglycan-binding domain-containing protein [Lawsonibacter sp.]